MKDLETKLRIESERGDRAKRLLEDPLIIEAITLIRTNCMAEWENAKEADSEGRERAWRMLHACNEFHRHLSHVMTSGKAAKHELTFREKLTEKVRSLHRGTA